MAQPVDQYWVQHDTRPALVKTLLDASGAVVNVTGATVVFNMTQGSTVKVSRGAAMVTDGPNGVVSYTPTSTDTATAGEFQGEFEVTYAAGGVQTFPSPHKMRIVITPEIA